MFIELTDHLRCTADHQESFLVLLPGALEGRRVVTGDLGCPVCGREMRIVEGVLEMGGARPATGTPALSAEAVAAFWGLSGPGGYLALAGNLGALASGVGELLPGVSLVLVNPAAGTPDSERASVVRAFRLPLKSGSMRGIALGADLAADPGWVEAAALAVLPGLRVVVEGNPPAPPGVEILAEMPGCWVGRAVPERLRPGRSAGSTRPEENR